MVVKLGHVHLKVADIERAERFYVELLGALVTERLGRDFVFLSLGERHHDLALQQVGGWVGNMAQRAVGPEAPIPGLYHVAFELSDGKALLDAVNKLEQGGVGVVIVDHRISIAVYLEDPDGNGVELYIDRRGSVRGAPVWEGRSRALSAAELAVELAN